MPSRLLSRLPRDDPPPYMATVSTHEEIRAAVPESDLTLEEVFDLFMPQLQQLEGPLILTRLRFEILTREVLAAYVEGDRTIWKPISAFYSPPAHEDSLISRSDDQGDAMPTIEAAHEGTLGSRPDSQGNTMPTVEEIRAAIPQEDITVSVFVELFKLRIRNMEGDREEKYRHFESLVKKVAVGHTEGNEVKLKPISAHSYSGSNSFAFFPYLNTSLPSLGEVRAAIPEEGIAPRDLLQKFWTRLRRGEGRLVPDMRQLESLVKEVPTAYPDSEGAAIKPCEGLEEIGAAIPEEGIAAGKLLAKFGPRVFLIRGDGTPAGRTRGFDLLVQQVAKAHMEGGQLVLKPFSAGSPTDQDLFDRQVLAPPPTVQEIRAADGKEGISTPALVRIFSARLRMRNENITFISIVRQAANQDPEFKLLFLRDS